MANPSVIYGAILGYQDVDGNFVPVSAATPLPSGPGSVSSFTSAATIQRAANQTPYSIGDVVGAAFELPLVGPSGGWIDLLGLRLLWNIAALPAGMTTFDVQLYNVAPPSAIADNSPWTLASGDRVSYLGKIPGLPVAALGTGTQSVGGQLDGFLAQRKLTSASLFGYLVTPSAYTPAANSETGTLTAQTSAA